MGYYDPYPLIHLERPLCLIGFMGSDVHSISYFLASMTGLPFTEVDKLVEHEVGMSLAELYLREGELRWRQLEKHFLSKALSERPARLICLGDGALLRRENLELCLQSSELVYIRRPRISLLDRVTKARSENIQRLPYLVNAQPHSDELLALLKEREVGYEHAHRLFDAGELSSLEAAHGLSVRLGWSTSH